MMVLSQALNILINVIILSDEYKKTNYLENVHNNIVPTCITYF